MNCVVFFPTSIAKSKSTEETDQSKPPMEKTDQCEASTDETDENKDKIDLHANTGGTEERKQNCAKESVLDKGTPKKDSGLRFWSYSMRLLLRFWE